MRPLCLCTLVCCSVPFCFRKTVGLVGMLLPNIFRGMCRVALLVGVAALPNVFSYLVLRPCRLCLLWLRARSLHYPCCSPTRWPLLPHGRGPRGVLLPLRWTGWRVSNVHVLPHPPQVRPSEAHNAPFWTTNSGVPVWNNNQSLTGEFAGRQHTQQYLPPAT